jgi:N-acetylglutamate synthase-like GNAT family acetyltransferase
LFGRQEHSLAEFRLRPAVEHDSTAIRALIHEVGINPLGLSWQRFLIAESLDGRFAGCAQLKPHADGSLELASLAVVEFARGQGVASLLVKTLMDRVKGPLYLTCRPHLEIFYQQYGFRRVEQAETLPAYFRRIQRLAKIAYKLRLVDGLVCVMVAG